VTRSPEARAECTDVSSPALAQGAAETPRGREGSGPRRASDLEGRSRRRVLLVEDDEDTRAMYAWAFKAGGWLVQVAVNGHEAVAMAPLFEPDVIVMDLHLPVVDGFEAIRRLREVERTRRIPVVALSGAERSKAEILARQAGCDAFLAKPFLPEDLRAFLDVLLSEWNDSSA